MDTTTDSGRSPDWFCISCKRYYCANCEVYVDYVHDGDRIVVWPEKDDPVMLRIAMRVKKKGGESKIVEYDRTLGKSISYYKLD